MTLDIRQALAAMGEPSRFRIVELLADRPRTVGEVAEALGALQPQTTKHIQALEAAGIVRLHKLGRRRVARLDRPVFGELVGYFDRLAHEDPDDEALESYEREIAAEAARPAGAAMARTLHYERRLQAPREAVWQAWTDAERAATWWAPRHFSVESLDIVPRVGTPIRLVLREGSSAIYSSSGQVTAVDPGRRLVFSLAPVDDHGKPLFTAIHTVTIEGDDPTILRLVIEVSDVRSQAVEAVAGLHPGWAQLLDTLQTVLSS